jgi:hypothetical protein
LSFDGLALSAPDIVMAHAILTNPLLAGDLNTLFAMFGG